MEKEIIIKGSTNSILLTNKLKDHEEQEDPMINEIFFKKFKVIKKLGKTSNIDLYEGISIENNKPVLIKIEEKKKDKIYLEAEAYNLYSFKGFGIPELIKMGKRKNNIILIESKKGPSLYELFIGNKKKFSLNEICLIGIQCIERLKFIHSKNYIHRNIKPENFVIGIEDPHVIYLQNFYLCEKYKSSKTNQHAKLKYTNEFVGTERYGSINALRGLRQGRKDDLESLCYMLIFFFLGKLPWQGLKEENETLKHEKILKEKKKFKIENYKIPKDFCTLFNYVRNLKFEEEPKYSSMIKLLENIRSENQCFSNTDLFWIKKDFDCKGANIKSKKDGYRERLCAKIDKSYKTEQKSDFEKKLIKNEDVNFENFGLGYIDEDLEEEINNEKSAFQIKTKLFLENKKEDELQDNNDNKENDLNLSNSSINTKVYKLNEPLEKVVKKDLMNDPEIKNIDELQKDISQKSNEKIVKISNISNNYNNVIKEEDIEEDDEDLKENKEEMQEKNNTLKENQNSKTIVSSNLTRTTKEESIKESNQFNCQESEIKGNNNPGSIILEKNNSQTKKNKINNENTKQKNKEKKSVDNKILITKKTNDKKYGQIAGPKVKVKRSKTANKIPEKKVKNKDCIIF